MNGQEREKNIASKQASSSNGKLGSDGCKQTKKKVVFRLYFL